MLALDAPTWLKEPINKLSLSYHQEKLLARYVTGLIASGNKTIAGISSMFMKQSIRSMNRLMTEYPWDTGKINMERLEELQKHNETRWSKYGIIIIDDTIMEKTGKDIPYVGKLYDHSEGRFVNGHCIVSTHYADDKTSYAIDYRLYVKKGNDGFKTKIELARELVEQYRFIPAQTVVWDTWYTCKEMVEHIEGMNKFWIGACRSNVLVKVNRKYVTVGEWANSIDSSKFHEVEVNERKFKVYNKHLYIKSLGCFKRMIVSIADNGKDRIYLLTNRSDHVKKIIADYMLRWKIENFHKDAKQHLGLGKVQVRNIEGIKKHWYLVFLAHSLLRLGVSESSFGRTLIRSIGKKAKSVCLELLEGFISWIVSSGNQNKVHQIMEVFLYRQT